MTLKSFVVFFNVYLLEGFFFRKGRELESVTAQNQDTGPYFLTLLSSTLHCLEKLSAKSFSL